MSQQRGVSISSSSASASASASSVGNMEDNQSDSQRDGIQLFWAEDSFVEGLEDMLLSTHEIQKAINQGDLTQTLLDYFNKQSITSFPISLTLNRSTEEPPYPSCSQRGITWRRVLSCLPPASRPDYYLKQKPDAEDYGYSNESYKLGNLCVQIVGAANYVFPQQLDFVNFSPKDYTKLRTVAHKNLCILGLLLFQAYLREAWNQTYSDFANPQYDEDVVNRYRGMCLLRVNKHVYELLYKLMKLITGKTHTNRSNLLLELDPIFDSDVLRSYIWNLIFHFAEVKRNPGEEVSEAGVLVEEYTHNIYRDRPGKRDHYSQERMRSSLTSLPEGTTPWSGIFEIDRWEFIRHRARVLGVPPDYGNASLLERALLDYQEPGALDVEPSIVNRRIYQS